MITVCRWRERKARRAVFFCDEDLRGGFCMGLQCHYTAKRERERELLYLLSHS